ncbi:uncharacterized protein RSE6_01268 [Rhynchosporium secalis]|uniref:Uncharacterized protein n=1 Tax=Rhynchosporium secalis TaxID=38038 RepID=A0A1E1LXE6_RHYSE|nr:uncharacterized protein RSE6_01268 [Rhynchosporium secalis]
MKPKREPVRKQTSLLDPFRITKRGEATDQPGEVGIWGDGDGTDHSPTSTVMPLSATVVPLRQVHVDEYSRYLLLLQVYLLSEYDGSDEGIARESERRFALVQAVDY